MKKLRKLLPLATMTLLTVTSCGIEKEKSISNVDFSVADKSETAYLALADQPRKKTISFAEQTKVTNWNCATTMQQEDSAILVNLIEPLVQYNEYNELVPDMATSVPTKENGGIKVVGEGEKAHYEVTFDIRTEANWVKNTGRGGSVVEGVKAQDWVTAAQVGLDFSNFSESSYMWVIFVQGAKEYNTYTLFKTYASYGFYFNPEEGGFSKEEKEGFEKLPAPGTSEFTALTAAILGVDASVIPDVDNFSRVGIKASEDGKKLTFTLTGQQDYFVGATTYTPFFPVPTDYYTKNPGSFGSDCRHILSNGPYVVEKSYKESSTEMYLIRSDSYWDRDHVMNDRIKIKYLLGNIEDHTARSMYEKGQIDSFGVNPSDEKGWAKYVTGGTPDNPGDGTLFHPKDEYALSREGLGEGSSFAYFLNTWREAYTNTIFDADKKEAALTSSGMFNYNPVEIDTATKLPKGILNTNMALSFSPKLREAVLLSLDPVTYFLYSLKAKDQYQHRKYSINTYTPRNFITLEEEATSGGKDFVDYVETEYINSVILADARETAATTLEEVKASDQAYYELLVNSASERFHTSAMAGNALTPTYADGKFTGWEKDTATTTYNQAVGLNDKSESIGIGTGAVASGLSTDESVTWYTNKSRDAEYISNLVTEGLAEAQANIAKANINYTIQTPVILEYVGMEYLVDEVTALSATVNVANYLLNNAYVQDSAGKSILGNDRSIYVAEELKKPGARTVTEKDSKVLFVQSNSTLITKREDYIAATSARACTVNISGWGPDYSDPKTFADTLITDGDMTSYTGNATGIESAAAIDPKDARLQYLTAAEGGYDELVALADQVTDPVERAKRYAKAEVNLLTQVHLIKPVQMQGLGRSVSVRRVLPKGVSTVTFGMCSSMYKGYQALTSSVKASVLQGILDQINNIRKNGRTE